MLEFLLNIGVTEGLTFRAVQQEGVGMFIVPNPSPTRTSVHAVPAPRRKSYCRACGKWSAKLVHVAW